MANPQNSQSSGFSSTSDVILSPVLLSISKLRSCRRYTSRRHLCRHGYETQSGRTRGICQMCRSLEIPPFMYHDCEQDKTDYDNHVNLPFLCITGRIYSFALFSSRWRKHRLPGISSTLPHIVHFLTGHVKPVVRGSFIASPSLWTCGACSFEIPCHNRLQSSRLPDFK